VADGAGGLQAVIVGVAPPFALIVENAACIEAEIAADRAHVAVGRPGDVRGGLREHGIMPVDRGMLGNLAQPDRRAQLKTFLVGSDGVQFLHAIHVNQDFRRDDAAADVHHEIGAAAERHAAGIGRACRDDLVDRPWVEHAEVGQGVH
jgi:hypothetical protein